MPIRHYTRVYPGIFDNPCVAGVTRDSKNIKNFSYLTSQQKNRCYMSETIHTHAS